MKKVLLIIAIFSIATATVTDIDGNVYQTVQIGDQLWMAENLKTTHYNNGDEIPTSHSDSEWINLESGGYSVYENNIENLEIYGYLYNWYVVNDERGVCPSGFEVPDNDDFVQLELELGMPIEHVSWLGWNRGTNEGSKIAGNAELWYDGNLKSNVEFGSAGLNLLPGGFRHGTVGLYYSSGQYSYLWLNTNDRYSRFLEYNTSKIIFGNDNLKQNGYSVRCVADANTYVPPEIDGCMDSEACNYNELATNDDGSCLEFDCAGDCGGSAISNDCGVCVDGSPIELSSSVPGFNASDVEFPYDWAFPAVEGEGDLTQFVMRGDWWGKRAKDLEILYNDEVICSWQHPSNFNGCAYDVEDFLENGSTIDCNDEDGSHPSFSSCTLTEHISFDQAEELTLRINSLWGGQYWGGEFYVVGGEYCPLDCAGVGNGDAEIDDCGVCDGNNESMDLCGICDGDNSTCSGCTDPFAINYDPDAAVDDGSCELPASENVVWKFDIKAEMVNMNGNHLVDAFNRIGFYYGSQEEAAENGIIEPMPPATDLFDAYWDVPEPMLANPSDEIHFYVENDWTELTGWGHYWAYDIRTLKDDYYASNNTTIFNGKVIADLGGQGTLTISPSGDTKLTDDDDTYVPVYAKVTGAGHDGAYFKIEGETTIPLDLETATEASIDFIVGNLVPEAADDLSLSTSLSADANGANWKPSNGIQFSTDASCNIVTLSGINYEDLNGESTYELIQCNDYEQRYPANSYSVQTDSDGNESGMESGSHNGFSKDSNLSDGENDLEFSSEYTYTVTASNGAGTGESVSGSITTVGNVNPEFTDLCDNDGGYNNDCETVIETSATGHDGTALHEEDDLGLVTTEDDDLHLYHTYTPLHDGCGILGGCGENGDEPGLDADGIDQSGTQITVSLNSAYTDHEGYLLDADWTGELNLSASLQPGDAGFCAQNCDATDDPGEAIQYSLSDGSSCYCDAESLTLLDYCDDSVGECFDPESIPVISDSEMQQLQRQRELNTNYYNPSEREGENVHFSNGNSSSVQFNATEPNSGEGSSFTFDLTVTDNEWLTNNSNGSNSINTSITVNVLPEPNQAPVAKVTVPEGQFDQDGGAYWQVPHNGDNEYTCNDLIAYDEQDCDDNKAEVTLSYVDSFDPDCDGQDDHCEEFDHWWSEALMGLTFNDLNDNGYFDDGEPCEDATECLWSFNPDGFEPSINDGELSHADEHSQRLSGGSGYIWTMTVQDNYAATHTSARGFYVLPEPNTRAYATTATDAASGFEVDSHAGAGADDDFHFIPEGENTTFVEINEGSVSDFDGDVMSFTTTLNGDLIYSGNCEGGCITPGFSRDLGVGDYIVETCVLDSYEGYEYLLYAQETGVDQSVEVTQNAPECASFTFSVLPEPAPVHVSTLDVTDQGMSYIAMAWEPSDFTDYPDDEDHANYAQLDEYGENAVHYTIERSLDPEDVTSWQEITELKVLRDYSASDCSGKEEDYENYADGCQDPTEAQADDDGEWYYTGRGEDGRFHFLDEGLNPFTTYHYRIFATNSHGFVSIIGNVLSHSTEAKPQLSFDRDMSAEIYAVGNETNTLTSFFTASDGLNGHNVSSVASSYSTYEGTTDIASLYSGTDGADTDGPASVDLSYSVTAWETDHNQSIEVCFEDAGDYWGYDKEGSCLTTATFTGSEEFLHKEYTYSGWHMFGSPMYKTTSVSGLFGEGLSELELGSEYVWFTESGNFGESIQYIFGNAYILGLYPYLTSFTMQGNILSSVDDDNLDNDLSLANHSLDRGWNLIAPKLIRPIDVDMLAISDEGGYHTWNDAHDLGIVSGDIINMHQYGYSETSNFAPWNGYWVHSSKECELIVEPHGFDLAKEESENDYFSWNLNIEAKSVDGEGFGDIIKLGLSDIASDEIKDGEDTEDIPLMTMMDKYIDLYMVDDFNQRYWKNTKSMISPDESQVWIIKGNAHNTQSDILLSWSMDELDEEFDITLVLNGNPIDMRAENQLVIKPNELFQLTVIVGIDPLASGLALPTDFGLSDAYPNPFNPSLGMQIALNEDGFTTVKVFNLMGQEIHIIHDGFLTAGYHQLSWDASDKIPSGFYFIKAIQGENESSQKVLLMK